MTLDFDTICRTCMSQSQALMYIFGDESTTSNDIGTMLQSITSIQASKNDGLPENVCIGCLSEINRAFSFKNRSERSEHTLKQYLSKFIGASASGDNSTNSVMADATDEDQYEVIEVDEPCMDHDHDEQNLSNSELAENDNSEVEDNDENPNNKPLDRRKVFVLGAMTPLEHGSSPVSVLYECNICYDTFDSLSLSEQHMTRFHQSASAKESKSDDESTNQKCLICSLSFDNPNSLDQHIREKHSNEKDIVDYELEDVTLANVVEVDETTNGIKYEWEDENYDDENIIEDVVAKEITSNHQNSSVIVITSQSIEPELKFNCDKCGGRFAKERSLSIHIKLKKCTVKSFECNICKKVLVRKKNLELHMQTHDESNEHSCKICSEKFTKPDKLAIHIQTLHEPTRKYLCPYCWKGFNVSSSLKDHIRTHNGERPYLCSICGKGFSQSTNLNQHVMRHNKTKPYSCSICSYSFVSKGELDAHSRKHSGLHPMDVVETIPDGMENIPHISTYESWKSLIDNAQDTIEIGSYYWTLQAHYDYNHSTADQGQQIYESLLRAGTERNVTIRITKNPNSSSFPNYDTRDLVLAGAAEVRYVNFGRLIGSGILHTKMMVVDRQHVYIGSSNFDWRALTQVKEIGVTGKNCPCLGQDLGKAFDVYWRLGEPGSQIPEQWGEAYESPYNKENPMNVAYNGVEYTSYISSAPPQFCPRGRTNGIDAIFDVIDNANEFVHIAVMDYFPLIMFDGPLRYWPDLDNKLRSAAIDQKIKVKLLMGYWVNTRDSAKNFLSSLESINGAYANVDLQVKMYVVPTDDDQINIPFFRVNHNKYVITDKSAYFSTSNWSGDYFIADGGIGIIVTPKGNGTANDIRDQLQKVFERDWYSQHARSVQEIYPSRDANTDTTPRDSNEVTTGNPIGDPTNDPNGSGSGVATLYIPMMIAASLIALIKC